MQSVLQVSRIVIIMPLVLIILYDLVSSSTYPCAILTTLLDIVRTKIAAKHDDVSPCIHTLVPRLFQTAIQAALQPSSSQMILSKDVLETAALLIMAVYENLDAAAQKEFLDRVYALYFNNELSLFDIPSSDAFAPLEVVSLSSARCVLIWYLAGIIARRTEDPYATLGGCGGCLSQGSKLHDFTIK